MRTVDDIVMILKALLTDSKFIDAKCSHVLGPLGDETDFHSAILKMQEEDYKLYSLPVSVIATGEVYDLDILGRKDTTYDELIASKGLIDLPSSIVFT